MTRPVKWNRPLQTGQGRKGWEGKVKKLMLGKGSRKPGDRHSPVIKPHGELGRIPTGEAKQVDDGEFQNNRATGQDAQ